MRRGWSGIAPSILRSAVRERSTQSLPRKKIPSGSMGSRRYILDKSRWSCCDPVRECPRARISRGFYLDL
jgi:hypothetical protein